jgi:cytochrome c oxidase cbb3-type subunit 3
MKMRSFVAGALPAAALVTLAAGGAHSKPDNSPPLSQVPLPSEGEVAHVPLGDIAGGAESTVASHIGNPKPSIQAGVSAVEEGRRLFVALNCADCHGFDAKGGMGPNLTDKYWRYGGTPAAIFKSIFEGRPKGMPAWGASLPAKDIWALVAYIQSLGGTYPADFYQPSLQGDKEGELVAPEIQFLQENDGSPPYQVEGGAHSATGQGTTKGGAAAVSSTGTTSGKR